MVTAYDLKTRFGQDQSWSNLTCSQKELHFKMNPDFKAVVEHEISTRDLEICCDVALRSALRNFLEVNHASNQEMSRRWAFVWSEMFIRTLVYRRFDDTLSNKALSKSLERHFDQLEDSFQLGDHARQAALLAQSADKAKVQNTIRDTASRIGGYVHNFKAQTSPWLTQDSDVLEAFWITEQSMLRLNFLDFTSDSRDIFDSALWLGTEPPDTSARDERVFHDFFHNPAYEFWREWYQGFLDGKPLDWELQRRVALIDDAIWEQGPEAVAAAIDNIKAEMLSEKLPMAETIEVNPATGKFRAVPIPVQNHPHMSALLNQVEDALEDCLGGHNGLRETAGDVRKLNRVLGKYREDPQNAELTLSTVAGSLRRQIHESRELADNEDNLALLSTVEDAVRGIRAEHPEVEENRLKRASLAVQELPEADKALLQSALPVLEELSDEPLGEDFGDDFEEMLSPRLLNDAVGPVPALPAEAKPLMGEYRAFSRISKIALLVEKGAKIFDSKEIKSARLAHLGYTVVQLLTQLVQIGWRLFEVLL